MRKRMDTEEFAAMVAAPLKADVPLGADFESRVMRAVEDAARPWWQRRRSVSFTPLGGMALAAAFGGLMVLGGVGLSRMLDAPPAVVAAAPDTVHVVRFVFTDAVAQQVSVAGDFNGWSRTATPLEPAGPGRWVVEIPLAAGRHEYAFIVDGERWVADPFALTQRDEFGQESSVVRVGDLMRGA